MLTRSKTKDSSKVGFIAAFLDSEPRSYKDALQCSTWHQSMLEEVQALHNQKTWSLVPSSPHQHVVGCKWVFRIKKNSDGSIARYKSRLVAKDYLQEAGVDFLDTFSPVAKQPTIRVFLCAALHFNWSIKQLDVSNAFLHGKLEEEVFMAQPPGFEDPQFPTHVCRLNKALYGLKQAPRAWFSTFSSFLLQLGFLPSHCDNSLFVQSTATTLTYLLVYVDDILITRSSSSHIQSLISQLNSVFSLKDLGSLSFFLGISVTASSSGLFLSQSHYAAKLLQQAGMTECKPAPSPISSSSSSLSICSSPAFSNPSLYRSLVGGLQYLTLTRPDLAFAVNQACQHLQHPSHTDFAKVKRLLRFVQGTLTHGLHFSPSSFDIHAFSDADWAGNPCDKRSTSGFCLYLGSNLVSWTAKKQPTVTRSSTKAEYRSMAQAAAEVSWLQMLLHDMRLTSSVPMLWCDNLSALSLASNPIFHGRTKHIEIDYHFVREKVAAKHLLIRHVPSSDQIADVFTKALPVSRFLFSPIQASCCSSHFPLEGG